MKKETAKKVLTMGVKGLKKMAQFSLLVFADGFTDPTREKEHTSTRSEIIHEEKLPLIDESGS